MALRSGVGVAVDVGVNVDDSVFVGVGVEVGEGVEVGAGLGVEGGVDVDEEERSPAGCPEQAHTLPMMITKIKRYG